MNEDAEQLRRYAESGSEDAFSAFVEHYVRLVYASALRRVGGDGHRAEDVTQLVFTAVARDAAALARHPDITGWLFTTTRFLAGKAVRQEQRRQQREQEAYMSAETDSGPAPADAHLHRVLDEVMMDLKQLDRQMLLLRFHRGLRMAEIGALLAVSENAAQKRIDRALEQMKEKLQRRGVTSTAVALAVALEQQSAVAVPVGLAAAATGAGIACGAGAGGLLAISSFMIVSKFQLGAVAAVVVIASVGLVWEVRESAKLRAEISQRAITTTDTAELRKQIAAQSQRADAAAADAAMLRKASQAASAARPTAPAGRPALVDLQDRIKAVRTQADKLAREGRSDEALKEYLGLYRELRGNPRGVVENQLLMSALLRLGKDYPPALAALRELRDAAVDDFRARPSDRALVSEITLLNERLGEGTQSVALYDSLPPDHPGRQSIGLIAYNAFVEARRYSDAFVGKNFGGMMNDLDRGVASAARLTGQSLANQSAFFVQTTLSNIEVLTGVGQLEEARTLTEKLLAFDSSEATRAAIQRHVARANQPKP